MAAPDTIERAPTERLQFLDAVRGFALLLMIVNHTSRWWQDGTMGWPRYNLIYASMVVGAPLFLFLVGFCLPLSFARRRPTGGLPGVAAKFLQRGGRLILASWLLNFVVFRDEPFWEGGVLQTVSRTLLEQVRYDRSHVTSIDWLTYPILTFPDVPDIDIELIDRPQEKPWGVGEPSSAIVSAAICNAVFDAIGVRLRQMFDEVVNEPVPDEFLQILRKADADRPGEG